jgi:UPF0755 protein
MKRLRFLLVAALAMVIAVVTVAFALLGQPYRGFRDPVFVEIPRGMNTMQIAGQLAAAGVVSTRWHVLLARVLQRQPGWQAGEYRFDKAATSWEISTRLSRGDIYLVELRIPEGYNIFDIARLVEAAGLAPAERFLAAASNPALIRDLAPGAPSLEGFLFPSTYRVPRRLGPEGICRVLTEQFRREWKSLNGGGDVLRKVTLASLVEKETGVPEERPLVAGLYWNRVEKGMKLEADPTTIYAALLEGRWRGTIYRSDLAREHPYNTYAVSGLPPGPIASPGRSALAATLHPQDSDYIFFVARPDGSGRHVFSKSYGDHARAVADYRRGIAGQ